MIRFHGFCVKCNVVNPVPVTEQLLCSFVSFLADEGLTPQTGKSYLAAVRNMQISLGLPDPRESPSLPVLKRVQASISHVRMLNKGSASRIRLPVTIDILDCIHQALMDSSHPEKGVIWAIACLAFFWFFRLGKLLLTSSTSYDPATCLSWGVIAVNNRSNPTMVQLHLKKLNCDQFRCHCWLYLC